MNATPDSEVRPSVWGCHALATPRDRRNLRRVNLALFVWAVVYVGGTALVRFGAVEGVVPWVIASAAFFMAILAIRRFVLFLREADELLRLVQLEGLALGFGSGFVFMTTWRLLERAGAPRLDVADPLLAMCLFYVLGQFFAARRYS